jgi:hypothetical protein
MPKQKRKLSTDPRLVAQREYMREYRRRKAEGEPTQPRPRYTNAQKNKMMVLREEGFTYREIAEIVGVDYTGVRRWVKRLGGR